MQCDLVLVIGSRNSSNSNRLVEVAREHGADSHLIDNESEVREEWLDGKRVVGITSGASAPEELVQRLVEFFRARGTADVQELEVVQEDVRFMLPKVIRQAVAAGAAKAPPSGAADHPISRCARWSSRTFTSARAAGRTCCAGSPSGRRCWRVSVEFDRLVLLGDTLELRHGPARDALAAAAPVLARARRRARRGARSSWCPATTTTRCCEAGSSGAIPTPLGLEIRASSGIRGSRSGRWSDALAPASVRVAYPGVWLRDDVYAIHGHYGDRHNTVPILERLGAGLTVRVAGEPAGGPASAEDYEAALAPMYAWADTVAQSGGLRLGKAAAASRCRPGTG